MVTGSGKRSREAGLRRGTGDKDVSPGSVPGPSHRSPRTQPTGVLPGPRGRPASHCGNWPREERGCDILGRSPRGTHRTRVRL